MIIKVLHRRQRRPAKTADKIRRGRKRVRQRPMDATSRGRHMRKPRHLQDTHRQRRRTTSGEHGRQHAVRHLRRRGVPRVHRVGDGGSRCHAADHRRQAGSSGVSHARRPQVHRVQSASSSSSTTTAHQHPTLFISTSTRTLCHCLRGRFRNFDRFWRYQLLPSCLRSALR